MIAIPTLLRDRTDTSLVVPPADTSATSTRPATSLPTSTDAPQTTPAPTTTSAVATTLPPATTTPSIPETSLPTAAPVNSTLATSGAAPWIHVPVLRDRRVDADGTLLRTLSDDERAERVSSVRTPRLGQTRPARGSRPAPRPLSQPAAHARAASRPHRRALDRRELPEVSSSPDVPCAPTALAGATPAPAGSS